MRKKRILIIDNEAAFLLALKRILQGSTVSVDTAETFDAAMDMLNKHAYQVVIADIRLTGVFREEGLEILCHVKKHVPRTRVVILTAYGQPGVMERARDMGADLFIEKPVPPHILQNTLRSWGIEC